MPLPQDDHRPEFLLLENEILTDPAGIGYAGMTNAQALTALTEQDQDNWVNISSAEVFEAIDPAEFTALNNANKDRVDRVLGLGSEIRTAPGSQARAELIAVFGGGSTTISTLASIANQQRSRAEIRGIPASIATEANIAYVRS